MFASRRCDWERGGAEQEGPAFYYKLSLSFLKPHIFDFLRKSGGYKKYDRDAGASPSRVNGSPSRVKFKPSRWGGTVFNCYVFR